MSELEVPPGYINCILRLHHSAVGHECELTWGCKIFSPPFTQANTDALRAAINLSVMPRFSDQVTSDGLTVYVGSDGDMGRFDSNVGVTGGNGSFDETTPNVAYLAKKTTALAGRRHRGRWYIPFPSEGSVDEAGNVAGATITAWNTALTNVLAACADHASNVDGMVILHAAGESAIPTPTPVTSFKLESMAATQRRRMKR